MKGGTRLNRVLDEKWCWMKETLDEKRLWTKEDTGCKDMLDDRCIRLKGSLVGTGNKFDLSNDFRVNH